MRISIIPDTVLRKITDKDIDYRFTINILVSHFFIVVVLYFGIKYITDILPHVCLFKYFTSYDCPG